MTTREIYAALITANADRCTPPLPKEEVRRIAASIGRYDPAKPKTTPLRPVTATELLAMTFGELRWAIAELVAEGVTILAGRPKEGKSLMALDFSLAVGSGGHALGKIPVARGDALYIGLEDSYRRLKARVQARLLEARDRDPTIPDHLHLSTTFPRLDEGASRPWTPGSPPIRTAGWW
jgi:hypothetical protein